MSADEEPTDRGRRRRRGRRAEPVTGGVHHRRAHTEECAVTAPPGSPLQDRHAGDGVASGGDARETDVLRAAAALDEWCRRTGQKWAASASPAAGRRLPRGRTVLFAACRQHCPLYPDVFTCPAVKPKRVAPAPETRKKGRTSTEALLDAKLHPRCCINEHLHRTGKNYSCFKGI